MEQMISALLVWATVLLVIVALFMVFRHVVLWYYCINERIQNQNQIIRLLQRIEENTQRIVDDIEEESEKTTDKPSINEY